MTSKQDMATAMELCGFEPEMVTSWEDLLRDEMELQQDPGPVLTRRPSDLAFHVPFDPGHGHARDIRAWTATRVYYPTVNNERMTSEPLQETP